MPKGHSVLEASRIGGIPHYSVCGGKGRCSTCRIRVTEGLDEPPPAGPVERITLSRIHAAPDVRLACQLRPTHDLTVLPLLAADRERALPAGSRQSAPGREQEIAVLFCDIRSFTALADHRLPYDIVFLLNRYFAIVGKAVEQSGGRLDKFIGDGAMALFGLETLERRRLPPGACRVRRDPRRARPAERGACRRDPRAAAGWRSASMPGRPSSARWAMAARCTSPRSATRSMSRAGSKPPPRNSTRRSSFRTPRPRFPASTSRLRDPRDRDPRQHEAAACPRRAAGRGARGRLRRGATRAVGGVSCPTWFRPRCYVATPTHSGRARRISMSFVVA